MMAARRSFSHARYLRESCSTQGLLRTVGQLLRGGFELVRDYLPQRRRMRYGDIDFDWDYRVDTTWANIRLGTRVREILTGRQYQPADPPIFAQMMQALPLPLEGLTFIDLGSGKGRALLLASNYPFSRIVGVELLPELHAAAQDNLRRYRSAEQKCSNFELHCCDAREYELPPESLAIFLFDPFPEPILREVVGQIENSMRRAPRSIAIAYMNPVSEIALAESQMFQKYAGTRQWAIYLGKQLYS